MDLKGIPPDQIQKAAAVIRRGGIIAFPTETYYGLGADPFNEGALKKLYTIKNRPFIKPVLVLVASRDQISILASSVPETAFHLMDTFWPGPLTMVLPARPELSPVLTGNTGTVGIRHSPHPVAAALLEACGTPVTATSANISGQEPAVSADDVKRMFRDTIDFILDGGRTPGMMGSTLIGFRDSQVTVIREGCIPYKDIASAVELKGRG